MFAGFKIKPHYFLALFSQNTVYFCIAGIFNVTLMCVDDSRMSCTKVYQAIACP
jgi:hypothetical protein